MKEIKLLELKSRLKKNSNPIVLYGAAFYCKIAIYSLKILGYEASHICDSDENRNEELFCGYNIISPEVIKTFDKNSHIFVCSIFVEAILHDLKTFGFKNFYDSSVLFDNVNFNSLDLYKYCYNDFKEDNKIIYDAFVADNEEKTLNLDGLKDNLKRQIELYKLECQKVYKKNTAELKLKYMDIVVTEACTMKCIDCSNLMQYYKNPKNVDIDLLFESIEMIVESVDQIYELRLIGGEPFFNKNLYKIINKVVEYKKVNKVIIYTNGTIPLKNGTLLALKNKKILLDISNYGKMSRNLDNIISTLNENKINYIVKKPIWTDSGRILKFQKRSKDQMKKMFLNCCVNDTFTLLNGVLYRCPYSANVSNLNAIPKNPKDFIVLNKVESSDIIRNKIQNLYFKKDYLTACHYCNGRDYTTPVIETAIQTKKPLEIPAIANKY